MKLSTNTTIQSTFGFHKTVETLAQAGFDAYDFSMFNLREASNPLNGDNFREIAREYRAFADSIGIACNQAHAPFWGEWEELRPWIIRALEITSILGGKICVVHPRNNWTAEENAQRVYLPLEEYARRFNVKIALENMWNWPAGEPHATAAACSTLEDFNRHLARLDPEWFVACLDLGHAEMMRDGTSAVKLIRGLGSRLQALHVHDNDKLHDTHTAPYLGEIDWSDVLSALRETGYSGDFTFECDTFLNLFASERALAEGAKYLHGLGRNMIAQIK